MTDVTLTAALRSNLLSLQGSQLSLDKTQLRLATGKKVNSALDNANSFFSSQSLNYRAGDLGNLLDGMGQSIQVLKAADYGLTSLSQLVQQAKAIATQARESASGAPVSVFQSGDFPVGSTVPGGLANFSFNTSVGSASLIVAGQTVPQIAANINSLNYPGLNATFITGTGTPATQRLVMTMTNGTLQINASSSATYIVANHAASGGSGATDTDGNAYSIGTLLQPTQTIPGATALQAQYDNILSQINLLVADTGYRGVNLLNGDTLKTKFNESGSSTQSVSGVTFNALGLGLTSAALSTVTAADSRLNEVTAALAQIRTQAKAFGNNLVVLQNRETFTAITVNTLKEGSDKLTLADKNEEGANLLSLQTSQQLGITALSLASQASQAVLRLFS